MRSLRSIRALLRELEANPFFRHEFSRSDRRAWAAALVLINASYLALFLAARLLTGPEAGEGPALNAAFCYDPWLMAGAGLLSLCAHWLIPPFLTSLHGSQYDLRTLALMIQGRHSGEEVFRGQVGAGLAPLGLGLMPLVLGLPALAVLGPDLAPLASAVFLGGLLWAAMVAGVSLWTAAVHRLPSRASLVAYGIASLGVPLLVGLPAAIVAYGCSLGHPDPASVFRIAAGMTGAILVTGLAGVFWDRALAHFFPERRRPLWQEQEPALPQE